MMFVDTRPRKRNAPRPAEKSAPGFLQWLRGRECACGGKSFKCHGKIQAAHINDKSTKGIATKCADRFAIPLSLGCHWQQHEIGWLTYAERYLPGSPLSVAEAYWRAWPGRIAWERKLEQSGGA